ncbi:hypothetical protein BpHYR1_003492 [Brachionus plicatilis]|uniref:Uncharacterized protein n=1 Tax=Brachionus plicatilis TaxID=10195 RepID=A0A3M7T0P9_BRAPC|nr:hypothetical protein BpHYR1_003492 [Brachionus plicatilis]
MIAFSFKFLFYNNSPLNLIDKLRTQIIAPQSIKLLFWALKSLLSSALEINVYTCNNSIHHPMSRLD